MSDTQTTGVWISASSATVVRWSPRASVRHRIVSTVPGAEDGQEYFFHRGAFVPSLEFERLVGGERVTFEIEASPKGPRATDVRSA